MRLTYNKSGRVITFTSHKTGITILKYQDFRYLGRSVRSFRLGVNSIAGWENEHLKAIDEIREWQKIVMKYSSEGFMGRNDPCNFSAILKESGPPLDLKRIPDSASPA